jgi:hypothetical protein
VEPVTTRIRRRMPKRPKAEQPAAAVPLRIGTRGPKSGLTDRRQETIRGRRPVNPHGTRGSPTRCPASRGRATTADGLATRALLVGLGPRSARLAPVRAEP